MNEQLIVGITRKSSGLEAAGRTTVDAVVVGDLVVLIWDRCMASTATEVGKFLGLQLRLWRFIEMVPFRFGQGFDGSATVATIDDDRDRWRALIGHIGGCGEISCYGASPVENQDQDEVGFIEGSSTPGRDYLQRRRQFYRRRPRRSDDFKPLYKVWETDRSMIRDQRLFDDQGRQEWVVLFDHQDLEDALEHLACHPTIDHRGPFPPWTFAELPAATGGKEVG